MASFMFANKMQARKTMERHMNKKAISEIVSYVLLIVLVIAMATATWFFLKPYAEKPLPEEECPESVNIILENYTCDSDTNEMNFSLRNRGLFNVWGIKLNIVNANDGLEYDFLWLLPNCAGVSNCKPCSDPSANGACIGVGKNVSSSQNYGGTTNVSSLVIYPIILGEKGYQVCTQSAVRIPIAYCD